MNQDSVGVVQGRGLATCYSKKALKKTNEFQQPKKLLGIITG
jgi:hypothetical protein